MMFFWVLIIIGFIYLLMNEKIDIKVKQHDSMSALNERLVSGEITIEEYNEIKKTIRGN